MNLSEERSTVEAPWPPSSRVSSIHDADAILAGGPAPQQRILVLAVETMPLGRNVHNLWSRLVSRGAEHV
jgi:hypothetical protein